MRQLWLFFEKYNIVFLFLFLEFLGFTLFFSRNNYQKSKFLNSTSFIQSGLAEKRKAITGYFGLREENEKLTEQNQKLIDEIAYLRAESTTIDSLILDSVFYSNFRIQSAEVITGKLNGGNNLLTISKGEKDSVKIGDGVINAAGAIGKIVETTPNYSLVMPLFNRNMRLNIQHQKSTYNGNLLWTGQSFDQVQVENISRTAEIEIGDTIITNQSKSIPSGTIVGVVNEINYDLQKNFYRLDVTPVVDFRKLNYVHIVQRKDIQEIEDLEKQE